MLCTHNVHRRALVESLNPGLKFRLHGGVIARNITYDVCIRRTDQLRDIKDVRCLPTNPVIGQVVGNVVARRTRPHYNCLLSSVFLSRRIFKSVDGLALEIFL